MYDKQLKRAGLHYHEYASVRVDADWASCMKDLKSDRIFALTTSAKNSVYDTKFKANDAFVFGSETAGLPRELLEAFKPAMRLRIPMRPGNRSLNLSNAVAVTVYEAWRQLDFKT